MSAESTTVSGYGPGSSVGLGPDVFDHSPLPVAAVDCGTLIIRYANEAFCRLMETTSNELLGQIVCTFLPKDNSWAALLNRVCESGKAEIFSEQVPKHAHLVRTFTLWPTLLGQIVIQVTQSTSGDATTVEMNEALIIGSIRQHELASLSDQLNARLTGEIEERKRVEEELRKAQALLTDRAGQLEELVADRTTQLSATNKQLEAFTYTVAHDLRTPLRAVRGFTNLLLREAQSNLSETALEFARKVDESARTMDELLTSLLNFSQMSQERINFVPVNVKQVIREVLESIEEEIKEREATVVVQDPWPLVLGHPSTLSRVLFNLIMNGMKYARPGVLPKICLKAEDRGRFVRVYVEDNGIGVSPDHQRQIFQLFARLHADAYPGTGIGLTIAKNCIERMGGKIGVESTPGEGSRFWFELRAA